MLVHQGLQRYQELFIYLFMVYIATCTVCIRYRMLGRSIANISDLIQQQYPTQGAIFTEARCRGKYAAEVGYRGYGPTYHTIYDLSYGECATNFFCMRRLNIFETTPFFTQRLVCHIPNLVAICNFLWLGNHCMIFSKL